MDLSLMLVFGRSTQTIEKRAGLINRKNQLLTEYLLNVK